MHRQHVAAAPAPVRDIRCRLYAALEWASRCARCWCSSRSRYLNRVYMSGAEHGLPGMLLRGLLAAICMLPPTILMGASLPAIVRWIEGTRGRRDVVGISIRREHGGRGARLPVGGILSAARVQHGDGDLVAAVAINIAVGIDQLCWLQAACRNIPPRPAPLTDERRSRREIATCRGRCTSSIALSGATALGAEVVWTRLLSMLLLAHGLRVLHHSGRVPVRPRDRQRGGSWLLRRSAAAIRAGLVPDSADRRHRLDGLRDRETASLLDRRHPGDHRRVAHVLAGPEALSSGDSPGHAVLGRELSARLRGGRTAG